MEKQVELFRINDLRNEEHFGFVKECVHLCGLLPEDKAVAQKNTLQGSVDKEDELLEAIKQNLVTAEMGEFDFLRDTTWNGYRLDVNAKQNFPDPEVQAAAKRLKNMLDTYGDPRGLPYIQENGVLDNLIKALETEEATADLELIHASAWLPKLKKYHEEFLRLFRQRNSARAMQENGAVKAARLITDDAYRKLIQVVNVLVLIDGEAAYAPFIDEMNRLIEYQRTVLSRRKAAAAKKAENKEENKGDNKEENKGDNTTTPETHPEGNQEENKPENTEDKNI